MIKKIIISVLFICSALSLWAYGQTGHRAISAIAQEHLNCRAKRAIKKLLGNENLVLISTYGDDIKVKWFGRKSNLHRVWDENMISSYRMSYSELAENMPKISRKVRKEWQKGDMLTWTEEMRPTTAMVYASAEQDEDLGYRYMYDYFETLRHQLHKAGIRLAGVLNNIF